MSTAPTQTEEQTTTTETTEAEKPKNAFFSDVVDNLDEIQPVDEIMADPPRLHELVDEAKKTPAAEDEDPAPADPDPTTEDDKPADPAPPPAEPKKSRLIKLDPPDPEPQPQPAPEQKAPEPAKAPEKAAEPDDSSFSEEQLEVLRLLEFGGGKDEITKAEAAKMRDYFRKEIEWADKNLDASKDEIEEYRSKHMPKVSPVKLRRLAAEHATEQAIKKEREENDKRLKAIEEKLAAEERQRRLAPRVEKEMEKFEKALLDDEAEVPGGTPPVFSGIAKASTPEEAAELYPDEYPIYVAAKNAAKEYLGIINGLSAYNPSNPTHSWLANFQQQQEQFIASDPKRAKQGGKTFLPSHEYQALLTKEPAKAAQHFTVQPEDILNAIMVNAHQWAHKEVTKRQNALMKRGWAPKPQEPKTHDQPKPAPKDPAQQSPKATVGRAVGSAPASPAKKPAFFGPFNEDKE